MSHGSAQWCHLANTMDTLRAAVIKQLNLQKVIQTPFGCRLVKPEAQACILAPPGEYDWMYWMYLQLNYLQTEYSSNSTTLNASTSSMIKYSNEYLISRNIAHFSEKNVIFKAAQTFSKDDWFGLVLCNVYFHYISHDFGVGMSHRKDVQN